MLILFSFYEYQFHFILYYIIDFWSIFITWFENRYSYKFESTIFFLLFIKKIYRNDLEILNLTGMFFISNAWIEIRLEYK